MTVLARQIEQAASFVRRRWGRTLQAGIILGTGLGKLAGRIDAEAVISCEEIQCCGRVSNPTRKGLATGETNPSTA